MPKQLVYNISSKIIDEDQSMLLLDLIEQYNDANPGLPSPVWQLLEMAVEYGNILTELAEREDKIASAMIQLENKLSAAIELLSDNQLNEYLLNEK